MTALFLYTRFVSNDKKEKKLILPSGVERPIKTNYDNWHFKTHPFFQIVFAVLGWGSFLFGVPFLFYNIYLEIGGLLFLIIANFLPSSIGGYVLGVLVEKLKMEELSGWAFSIGGISTMIFLTWYLA